MQTLYVILFFTFYPGDHLFQDSDCPVLCEYPFSVTESVEVGILVFSLQNLRKRFLLHQFFIYDNRERDIWFIF